MDLNSVNRSPREEGELEDGEICDDETEENVLIPRGDGNGRPGSASSRTQKLHQHPHSMLPLMAHPPPDFRLLMPYNLRPHPHGPFPPSHRQQCGPSGPDRPAPPPPGLGPHGEPSPRSNFWERSHGALGRFRHRTVPNGGRGGWNRGVRGDGNSRPPPGRYGPGESHINKKDSPTRKQKQSGRNQARKPVHSVAKSENGVDETFEDLLSKYKQIQLELECIRKEETMALEPKGSPARDEAPENAASIPETKTVPETASIQSPAATEEVPALEKAEKKVFQAFNIKPLRQKLPTPAELDALKRKQPEQEDEDDDGDPAPDAPKGEEGRASEEGAKTEETPDDNKEGEETATKTTKKKKTCVCCSQETEKGEKGKTKKSCTCCSESSASSEDSATSPDKPRTKGKVEEEELSELQLRLLALQSASKKWQQKEQQVMKESKDRITKASQEKSSASGPGPGPAPSGRQRVTTRSASFAAAAAAAERTRTRSKPLERERDRPKAGARPPERDRERANALERERPKPGSKPPMERGRPPAKPHLAKKMISPGEKGSAAKQAFRKQQLRTWKLQQQREQEETRRQEEEERRKREDEIRKIRDLSNQDEQYNRFMKLVGGRSRTRSKSKDREHRKSTGKQGLDASGNLYQYDNYDEVAMDTDSETNSPVPSPTHNPFVAEDPGCLSQMPLYPTDSPQFGMDFAQPFLSSMLSGVPPPPPPLPPPPDETEQPPKPPFADEEEEEEMLLRETCLMSMAHKRVAVPEEKTTTSGPPSPSPQLAVGVQLPPRGNLSTVSLNTVAQSRGKKFTRGHHVPRAPLVLPRHKAVVVSLNDSDDSDSDMDACSSTQAVFGGLEFMIKEARRTVEAAKPKGASGSEKENNPVRTPEALPEAKKTEYRLLKEEIASREKQKLLKEHSHSPRSAAASPAVSDSEVDSAKATAELQLTEAEERLNKHRALLQKDEAILRQLLQQELKKRESLKAAEAKVAKLKEQLLASEKIVSANKMLLKKLQEQVHRVEHRVSIKKSQAVKLERELAQAQAAAGRGLKRRTDVNQLMPSKLQRVDGAPRGSERHFAELIAQKQRLQQLESEYALKIQKLKEAQALRNRGSVLEPPAEPPVRASTPPHLQSQLPPPSSPFPLPQPSLHDLTQDKLTLDSEDIAEAEDHEAEAAPAPAPAAAAATGTRRHSLRQSGSFTKPKLEQLGSTPVKDSSGGAKPAKASAGSAGPSEMFVGLDLDALKQRYQQQARLGELLLTELHKVGEDVESPAAGKVIAVDVDSIASQAGSTELKPIPFGPYRSPLLVFKSYRFSPYYRTKEKLSLSSVTYSNTIEPKKCFCRFDLTGTCNDDDCQWQHMRNCTLTGNQLFQDILSYSLSLIGCSESSSDEEISVSTEKYIKKLFGANKDRMGIDQKAVLLVSKVNESKRHVPPYTTCKDMRRWRPKPSGQTNPKSAEDSEDEAIGGGPATRKYDDCCKTSLSALDVCVTSEDKRYFVSETDDISNLESSVLETPRDAQLWIKLAFRYLNQNEVSASECLDAALNTLSRALEDNCDNPEIWSHYLSLFSRRGRREEVQEMCEMAVEHAPDYQVWWTYLNLEISFEGKDYVCDRLLQYLLTAASSDITDKLSFQLMEALLHRVDLNLFTGRMESALAILQNALKSASERSMADHLTASDRALVWLSYIHLTEFDRLPSSLFNPADSSPSRLVSREPFQLPWRTPQDISTPPDILSALFEDAIHQCSDEALSPGERTLACMPLHTNLIFLNKLLERFDVGIQLCESLLEFCPESCTLRDALADLHIGKGNGDQAVSMWLHALAECPNNAEVFYHSCKFLMAQDKSSAIVPLFRGFILSLCEDEQSQKQPMDVLRHILGIPTEEILRGPIIKKDLEEQLTHQMPYLHLVHCRWQWLHGSAEETVDAFERALGSAMQQDVLHKLWMDYLLFSSSQQAGPAHSQSRLFSDLVQRCLGTVPSRLELPFSPAQYWSCYRFHNKVVSHYLSCLPQSQHALVLERLRYAMPNNTELSLRLLHQEWQDGNIEHLKFQARMLSSSAPKCLANWKIAIAVERELKEQSEVRLLYQQALQNLPLCAALWKDRLLFEAAEGGKTDKLRKLVDKCQEVGVSLSEPVNLGPGRTQGEDQ
ncbi:zinc finger C3H1 domain-containing protein-like isoform X3 [Centroberyx affinis]|uniref:zinc finger C3H1 domain-containing protein-like isoform X3 n=1 Tax=Centroberyx affinis TaxID=166261 RepID=UPI003A5BA3F5